MRSIHGISRKLEKMTWRLCVTNSGQGLSLATLCFFPALTFFRSFVAALPPRKKCSMGESRTAKICPYCERKGYVSVAVELPSDRDAQSLRPSLISSSRAPPLVGLDILRFLLFGLNRKLRRGKENEAVVLAHTPVASRNVEKEQRKTRSSHVSGRERYTSRLP
jgi:hypothetical protein